VNEFKTTMFLSERSINEFKEIYEKKFGKKLTQAEASESAHNLANFCKIIYDWGKEDYLRQLRLKKEPKGFHLTDGTYTCAICHESISGDSAWYDKFGIKCTTCQGAVEKRIIPGSICEKQDSWYDMWELDSYYDLKSSAVRKLIREEKLKARIVPTEDGKPHCYIFLIKDNLGVLHPKPESIVKQGEDGYISIHQPKLVFGNGKRKN